MTGPPRVSTAFLRRIQLFAALPETELRHLAATLHPLQVAGGAVLFKEGDRGDRFFIVLEGELEILKAAGTPEERLLGTRAGGESLGEMSLLNPDGLRTATVRARSPARLLELTRADFDSLYTRQPSLAFALVRMFSQRLRESQDEALADLTEKNRQLTEAYEELKAAHAQLLQKEKLEHELRVARDVQVSFMPRATPELPGWQFAAYWQAARQVSGDFYDYVPRPDGCLGLVIADVADKGMPAALFMALSRSTLRASLGRAASVAEGLAQANRLISADAADAMFVTVVCGLLDPASGELTYINAGHNPPLFHRAATGSFDWLTRTGMPLGLEAEAGYETRSLTLAAGDMLLLYTDGVPDAINANGAEFGSERLLQLVSQNSAGSAADLVAAFRAALGEFSDNTEQYDDITVLVVKREA